MVIEWMKGKDKTVDMGWGDGGGVKVKWINEVSRHDNTSRHGHNSHYESNEVSSPTPTNGVKIPWLSVSNIPKFLPGGKIMGLEGMEKKEEDGRDDNGNEDDSTSSSDNNNEEPDIRIPYICYSYPFNSPNHTIKVTLLPYLKNALGVRGEIEVYQPHGKTHFYIGFENYAEVDKVISNMNGKSISIQLPSSKKWRKSRVVKVEKAFVNVSKKKEKEGLVDVEVYRDVEIEGLEVVEGFLNEQVSVWGGGLKGRIY